MIYEERRTRLRQGANEAYARLSREQTWPALEARGVRVLCLLSGLIGDPATAQIEITRYADLGAWAAAQAVAREGRAELVERESVRLLRAISARPKHSLPVADHRPVYGYRRFFIRPGTLEEFAHRSEEGVWPRFEAFGCAILGLWTTVATTDPQEVVLLTGYNGPGHWEATRGALTMPEGYDRAACDRAREIGAGRGRLTLTSWVRLMRAVYVEGA